MGHIPLTTAALALTMAAPALAQTVDRPPVATTGSYAATSANLPASSWDGSAEAWNAHARACSARYRSYNPTTDMYFARPGVQRRCTLAASVGPADGSPNEFTFAQPPGVGAPLPRGDHTIGNESGTIIGTFYDRP